MKKYSLMTLALMSAVAGTALNAEEAATAAKKTEVATPAAAVVAPVATKLSAEESAFAGKLNEKNRKAFEQFTAQQRKAAMAETKAGSSVASTDKNAKKAVTADEAVQKVLSDSRVVTQTTEKKDKVVEKAAAPADVK